MKNGRPPGERWFSFQLVSEVGFICALTVCILTATILTHKSPGSLGNVMLAAQKTGDASC